MWLMWWDILSSKKDNTVHSSQKYGKEENIIQDDNDTIEDEEYFPENNHDNLKSMVLAPANSSKI